MVVFRESETEASYLTGRVPVVIEAVRTLAGRHPDWRFVGIPRYAPEQLRARLPMPNVAIPTDIVNAIALMASADLLLAGGGTMNIESAYFGTPTICCRPMTCLYEHWLLEHGLAHRPAELTAPAIVAMAEDLIGDRTDATALRRLVFPFDEVLAEIERLHTPRSADQSASS
jgi:predicted glycosyltransferase